MSRDIVDRIDELVDDQMAGYGQRSGYDYNRAEQRCPHCHRDWHGLAITERLEQMQREYRAMDPRDGECDYATSAIVGDYRYSDDDSPVLCPGSTFIGPRAPSDRERRLAEYVDRQNGQAYGAVYDSEWNFMGTIRDAPWVTFHLPNPFALREVQWPNIGYEELFANAVSPWDRRITSTWTINGEDDPLRMERWLTGDPEPTPEPEPEPPANPERWRHLPRLPRPSTRPPMWAARADGRRR